MSNVQMTIVPVDPESSFVGEGSDLSDGPQSTWDEPKIVGAMGPLCTLSDAVDWFIDSGDVDDGIPRLPVAHTDEEDGPPSVSLEENAPPSRRVASPPPRGARRTAGLLATALMGVGLGTMVAAAGVVAVGAGATTAWWLSSSAHAEPLAVAHTPTREAAPAPVEASADEAPTPEAEAPTAKAEAPAATSAAPPAAPPKAKRTKRAAPAPSAAPVEAAEASAPSRSARPPIVRPRQAGEADATPVRTVKVLTSPPAALIVVDGVDHGRTPLKLDLAPGAHQLVLEQGGVRSSLDVAIEPGTEAARLCFTAAEGVFASGGCP